VSSYAHGIACVLHVLVQLDKICDLFEGTLAVYGKKAPENLANVAGIAILKTYQ